MGRQSLDVMHSVGYQSSCTPYGTSVLSYVHRSRSCHVQCIGRQLSVVMYSIEYWTSVLSYVHRKGTSVVSCYEHCIGRQSSVFTPEGILRLQRTKRLVTVQEVTASGGCLLEVVITCSLLRMNISRCV